MGTYALVKDKIFTDFTLTCQARLVDSREFEFVWNYQDDFNYNYVMFHKLPHNNELFVLVDSMRYTITPFTDFHELDDNDYHRIRVQVKNCHFSVSFDDSVVVEGQDCTFSYGKVGMGSFGGWVYFDNFSVETDKEYISNVNKDPDVPEPVRCELFGNYPNPFNPATTIVFSLQKDQHIKLTIYNLRGQVVEVLVNESRHAGTHYITWEAPHLPSGVYFYELRGRHFSQQKKLLIIR
ncbi:T9SS type A sorting domain-containing protein [candidate division KSB1 bacterium]|nr:T9SS type A sorting domain-containing protein [candidate division KSB1 bacterium]